MHELPSVDPQKTNVRDLTTQTMCPHSQEAPEGRAAQVDGGSRPHPHGWPRRRNEAIPKSRHTHPVSLGEKVSTPTQEAAIGGRQDMKSGVQGILWSSSPSPPPFTKFGKNMSLIGQQHIFKL